MSQDLVRTLLAAGGGCDAESNVDYLLFVDSDKSFLNCQHWNGDNLTKQELLVDSVRPNSTAAILVTPTEKSAIYITPSSKLGVHTYDKDEREWFEDEESPLAKHTAHPNGKLVASPDATGRVFIFFQDPSQHLVSVEHGTWTSTILPINPVAGTPISTLATSEGELHVYYISAADNSIHGVIRSSDDVWEDSLAIEYPFTEEITSFCLGERVSYVLTATNTLLKVTSEGVKTQLGTVKDSKFVPETVEEARMTTTYYDKRGRITAKVVIEADHVRHTHRSKR